MGMALIRWLFRIGLVVWLLRVVVHLIQGMLKELK